MDTIDGDDLIFEERPKTIPAKRIVDVKLVRGITGSKRKIVKFSGGEEFYDVTDINIRAEIGDYIVSDDISGEYRIINGKSFKKQYMEVINKG